MKAFGFVLLAAAFLAGAVAAVWDRDAVTWGVYGPALAVAVLGVVVLRWEHRRVHHADDRLAAGLERLDGAMNRIVHAVAEIRDQAAGLSPHDVHGLIEERITEDVADFVEHRRAIARVHGLAAYAAVVSDFAAAERSLNRVWSASADGYVDEVRHRLAETCERFQQAAERLKSLA